MPPAPTLPGAPAGGGRRSPLAWLKTREGKIAGGAGAVLLVVLLALRRGGGGSAGGGVPLQGQVDQTLQDRLDQFGMSGGTLEDLIGSTGQLAGSVDQLRDVLETQNPLPTTPPAASSSGYSVRRIGKVGGSYSTRSQALRFSPKKDANSVELFLRELVRLNPKLKGRTTIPGGFALKVPK
jgi:hypothetical protein